MGIDPPYIYQAPTRYSSAYPHKVFDPKAVSRASLVPPAAKPKQDGPLLDFNRHPDSYLIAPYGNTNAKPMDPRTKHAVKYVRWVQLGFRIIQLVGAIGLLVCIICTKGMSGSEAWVIRLPPGYDIVCAVYGTYHLMRSASGRPAGSSASYHLFALVMDAGFVPFYVFTTMVFRGQSKMTISNDDRFTSFFSIHYTNIILQCTWLGAMTIASLHGVTFILSIYLVYIFRKINQLPPDLNPLEDNLTSRSSTKHKYKNSEISDKHISKMSESSFSVSSPARSERDSTARTAQPVDFMNTRSNSEYGYSPHNPRTAHASRNDLPLPSIYQRSPSQRTSQVDLDGYGNNHSPTKSNSPSILSELSHLQSMSSSIYTREPTPQPPTKSSKREVLSDNWFTQSGQDENIEPDDSASRVYRNDYAESATEGSMLSSLTASSKARSYRPLSQDCEDDVTRANTMRNLQQGRPRSYDPDFDFQPLGMNPPTPQRTKNPATSGSKGSAVIYDDSQFTVSRALTSKSGNSATTARSSNSPKSKYYGDLRSATQGIRGGQVAAGQPSMKNVRLDGQGRVLSRTGVDVTMVDAAGEFYMHDGNAWGGNGRRDVSGKAAEEGRGAGMWSRVSRRVSGRRP